MPGDRGYFQMRADYEYDVFGNRVEKRVDPDGVGGQGTTTTRYAHEMWQTGRGWPKGNENWDVWAELDGSNNLKRRFVHGDAVDQLFARIDAQGNAAWYLTDRMGSVRDIVNASGTVINHIDYTGTGKVTNETSPGNGDDWGWTARLFNDETGLQDNRARQYDPEIGRFWGEDPWRLRAGDGNLFRYVGNGFLSAGDPSGLEIVNPDKADAKTLYSDELIYRGGAFRKAAVYKSAINGLIRLREEAKKKDSLVTINVFYVDGTKGTSQFAAHAVAKSGDGSVNYYYGHGTGCGGKVDPRTLAEVKKSFAALKKGDSRTFGMNGCFPGPYNRVIPEENRIKWERPKLVMGDEELKISEADALARFYKDLTMIVEEADASLEQKRKVEINLYFGSEGKRADYIEEHPATKDLGTDYRFENWKPR